MKEFRMTEINTSQELSNILTTNRWHFFANTKTLSVALKLHEDGTLHGYKHKNETRWEIVGEELLFLNTAGQITGRLSPTVSTAGDLDFVGPSLRNPKIMFRLKAVEWEDRAAYERETRLVLKDEVARHGWTIGAHTYGRPQVHERLAKLKIGKFCSIASGVEIALGNHRIDTVSTYPFLALRRFWPSADDGFDHVTRGDVVIGNDVWIAASAFIGSGVTIGDGAVIGAHAVVSRDVPPYAIVVGNPGTITRYRFEPQVIDELLNIRWWNWPDSMIDMSLPMIFNSDIKSFIDYANKEIIPQLHRIDDPK